MLNLTEEEWRIVRTMSSLGSISALAAACRLILARDDERTFAGFMGHFVLGTFAGLMMGLAMDGWGVSETAKYAVVSAAALTAKQLLTLLIVFAQMLLDNPRMIWDVITSMIPRPSKDRKERD